MSNYQSILLGSVVAVIAVMLIATGAQAQTVITSSPSTVYTSPAAGDTDATIPAGSTVVVPASTGTARAPEVVNPPGAQAERGEALTNPPADYAADDASYSDAPQVQTSANGVTFVSGGVGLNAKAQMEAMAHNYRLKLMFAATTGHYLAEVNVAITDKSGASVLSTTTDGPFLLANLPAGTYTVAATYEGVTQTKQVSVGASGTRSANILFNHPIS